MTIHPERLWIFGPKPHKSDPNKCSFTKWSFQISSELIRDEKKGLELLPGSSFYEQTGMRLNMIYLQERMLLRVGNHSQ